MPRIRFALAVALLPAAAGVCPAVAPAASLDDALAYTDCMRLAKQTPDQAFEEALAWQSDNGGAAARHCAAVALIGLGHFGEAAIRLERLAVELGPGAPATGSKILGQAGQAWLAAGEAERAFAAQSAALKLTPKDPELWIDRAVTLATAKNYWEAIDDLNQAAELAPGRAEVLVLRASAYRMVDGADLALEDIAQALALEPDNAEAWILASTTKIKVGTAIMQMPARTPACAAMTAQTLYAALGVGVLMGLAMIVSGAIYDDLGGAAFHVMAVISMLGGLTALALARSWRGGRLITIS